MADKKRQHYVPRFYLKAFSPDADKLIHLVVIEGGKLITNAGLSQQCYEDYFYGKDARIENALCEQIEDPGSRIIGSIIRTESLPAHNTEDHALLYTFVLFQQARTASANEEMSTTFSNVMNLLFREHIANNPKFADIKEEVLDVQIHKPVLIGLKTSARLIPMVADLRSKLLINQTNSGFITSDHPVAMVNPYYHGTCEGSVAGWVTEGLQVFLPLSPRHTLVMYDPKVYKFGDRNAETVAIQSIADVEWLNKLQILNANECIYFRDSLEGQSVLNQLRGCVRLRRPEKTRMRTISTPQGEVLHQYKVDLPVTGKLGVCKILSPKKVVPAKSRQVRERHPEVIMVERMFWREVDDGRYQYSEYLKFLNDMRVRCAA